jgi:release factor glutamine methyltransferase
VLDLCTGTGCVALSLVYECPGLTVVATDIDQAAVELAHENACELGLDDERLTILVDDLATTLLADDANRGLFDVVTSNPPYVPTDECDTLPREIAEYEPRRALDGGEDGLEVFRRIVGQAKLLLKPGGLLACELHEATLEQAKAFCESQGFSDVHIHRDLADKPRIITARKPQPEHK